MKNEGVGFDVIVIGGGQAGLSVGYHLKRRGLRFVILDAHARIGDVWRRRWDSLRLFSPARFDGLDGLRFPASVGSFPTKDEMADYLESYAARFELPVLSGVRVTRLSRESGRYVVEAGERRFEAPQVVVAMSSYQKGRVPAFARELDPAIVQLHSSDYKGPSQLREGPVLLVGAGNTGAEIAMDLAGTRKVLLAGRHPGHVPFRIGSFLGRFLIVRLLFRVVFHRILTIETAAGRKARAKGHAHGQPLIRQKPQELAAAGVERVARVAGARGGQPVLDDGSVMDVANVVWCTGFDPGLSWIDLPIFEADGDPRHQGGIVEEAPGLYFVGQHFLYSFSSSMIHGVGRDAERISAAVERAAGARRGASVPALRSEAAKRGGAEVVLP